jgi:hypothetical protein
MTMETRRRRVFNSYGRPDKPRQHLEKIASALGISLAPGVSGPADGARSSGGAIARAEPGQDFHTFDPPLNNRPENAPQDVDKVESAPERFGARKPHPRSRVHP